MRRLKTRRRSPLAPTSHYAVSKHATEEIAALFARSFRIIVTRAFNYTVPGQDLSFLARKIVRHYVERRSETSLCLNAVRSCGPAFTRRSSASMSDLSVSVQDISSWHFTEMANYTLAKTACILSNNECKRVSLLSKLRETLEAMRKLRECFRRLDMLSASMIKNLNCSRKYAVVVMPSAEKSEIPMIQWLLSWRRNNR